MGKYYYVFEINDKNQYDALIWFDTMHYQHYKLNDRDPKCFGDWLRFYKVVVNANTGVKYAVLYNEDGIAETIQFIKEWYKYNEIKQTVYYPFKMPKDWYDYSIYKVIWRPQHESDVPNEDIFL